MKKVGAGTAMRIFSTKMPNGDDTFAWFGGTNTRKILHTKRLFNGAKAQRRRYPVKVTLAGPQ